MKVCSDKMSLIHSDIRGRNYMVSLELEKEGKKILKLNTGNPATFGFGMPESVRAALIEKMDEAVGYCNVRGMVPARRAIMEYHRSKGIENFTTDDIFIGNGVSEIANMITTALLDPGDEVLLPLPCYSLWVNEVVGRGAVPVYYRCDEENGWNPDVEHLKSVITPKTKVMVINNPNNPTGVLYSNEILLEMLDVARSHNLIVFSDEIYDRLVFDGLVHTSSAALAPDLTVVTMNGLSKSHCICGFRSGWLVTSGPEKIRSEISAAMLKLASVRLCANALMQIIIPDALADTAYTEAMIRPGGRLYEQRKATWEELDKIEGISYVKNQAAFYVFPKIKKGKEAIENDKDFALDLLLNKNILIVPGSGFSWPDPDHFRIVMLPEPAILRQAVSQMGEFIREKGL